MHTLYTRLIDGALTSLASFN